MSLTVTVVAAADAPAVWARLVDIARWPDWNPACVSTEIDGPPAPGTRMRWQLRLPSGRAFWTAPTLTRLEEPQRLEWEVRALGMRSPTAVTLLPDPDGTAVTLTSESRGPLAFAYRLTFPEKKQGVMWSGALSGLARSFG